MGLSDEFRKELKAGNLSKAFSLAVTEAVDLRITTRVASDSEGREANQVRPGHCLRTHINIIDGDIENEIGDQFIGNGPYRELQQFHLEQVVQGSQIINSNLKSLQKLFEVWLNTSQKVANTPVLESGNSGFEKQLLPTAREIPIDEWEVIPESSVIPDSVISSELVVEEGMTSVTPPENIPLNWSELPPTDKQEYSEWEAAQEYYEDESVWDDLLDSLPPLEAESSQQIAQSAKTEDWHQRAEREPSPELENSDKELKYTEISSDQEEGEGKQEYLDLLADEEGWDDWDIDDTEPLLDRPVNTNSSSAVTQDEDWDNLNKESDPFATTPAFDQSVSELETEEDWDSFDIEELEPYQEIQDRDNLDRGFEQSDSLGEFTLLKSSQEKDDNSELSNHPKTDAQLEQPSKTGISEQLEDESRDLLEDWFEETDSSDELVNSTITDDEELFADMQFEDFSSSPPGSEYVISSQDTQETVLPENEGKSREETGEKTQTPPPSSSPFPDQNKN
ncbi:MAG: hypothetical protein WA919_13165 [Coleofasciculaceae cyanobacterium]